MTGRNITAVTASGLGLLGMGGMALTRLLSRRAETAAAPARAAVGAPARTGPLAVLRQGPPPGRKDAVRAAQRLNRAAGVLAASVLADSAVEHYRGAFANKAMVTPLVTASLSLAVSAHGNADHRPVPHRVRDGVYLLAALTGVVGTGFHVYNIAKKPGGFSWQNLFYSAPIGAPAALSLSGAMGFLAERVRDTRPGLSPDVLGLNAGRVVGVTTAAGLLGTVAEAGLLHFRGAFNNPAMYAPVAIPPGHRGAAGRSGAGAHRAAAAGAALVAARDRGHGLRGRRLPRARGGTADGRLAQLEPERAERPAHPGAAQLHRAGAGRARGAGADGGPSR